MKNAILVIGLLTLLGCAHVSENSSPLGQNRYLITCDGNGHASTGDTLQCISKKANEICSKEGKSFRIANQKTYLDSTLSSVSFTGTPNPHTINRPHSSATVECY